MSQGPFNILMKKVFKTLKGAELQQRMTEVKNAQMKLDREEDKSEEHVRELEQLTRSVKRWKRVEVRRLRLKLLGNLKKIVYDVRPLNVMFRHTVEFIYMLGEYLGTDFDEKLHVVRNT